MAKRAAGEGSVWYDTKRGHFQAQARIHGRRRSYYGATRKEAVDKMHAAQRAAAGVLPVDGRSWTVKKWLEHWLVLIEDRTKDSTRARYRSNVELHLVPAFGTTKLEGLTSAQVETLYARLRRDGMGPAGLDNVHRTLRTALNMAVRKGVLGVSPLLRVDAPQYSPPEVKPIDLAAAQKLVATVLDGRRNGLRWALALAHGLRQGEALGLTWDAVNLETGTLSVNHQLVRLRTGDKGLVFDAPKGRGKERVLAILPNLLPAFREHLARQDAEREKALDAWTDPYCQMCRRRHRLVFSSEIGLPYHHARDWKQWRDILAEVGVDYVNPHRARHTTASMLLYSRVDMRVIQYVLGHSSLSTTANLYTHIYEELQAADAAALNTLLLGDRPTVALQPEATEDT